MNIEVRIVDVWNALDDWLYKPRRNGKYSIAGKVREDYLAGRRDRTCGSAIFMDFAPGVVGEWKDIDGRRLGVFGNYATTIFEGAAFY